ncbi:MAG: hypothetical protein LH614_14925 [Pyrinomonadaceae bacterium]|nr:hypothetical protein [Pyrinomonadaceae bacterium]
MENTPYSIYCRNRGNSYFGLICNKSDLIAVKILEEQYDSDNVCTEKAAICRCRVCGGFYKHEYSARYSEDGWMGDEHGWIIEDRYHKIEEPYSHSVGSSVKPALPLDEARAYGYTGEDFTWKNNRCNFALFYGELTCRGMDLQLVAYRESEARPHNCDKFYQCRRCGQWYLLTILPLYKILKPSNEHFPIEEAGKFGYDETKIFPKTQEKSLAALFIENSEALPPPDEWLKEKQSDTEQAEYAFFIVEKHFIRAGLKVKRERNGNSWITFASVLNLHIGKFAEAGEHAAMLKNLLAELTHFYEAATGKSFAYYLSKRLQSFVDEDASYRRIEPFLPAPALEKMEEMQKNPAQI